jgi:hypothetical protein
VSLDRIARYAAGYGEIARIQATFSAVLTRHGIDPSLETFEADILLDSDVVRRASKHAESRGVDFAVVARAALFMVALHSHPDPSYDPSKRPPFRPKPESGRTRLRFWVPREPYEEAKREILASGRSVSHALEDKLRQYADEQEEA